MTPSRKGLLINQGIFERISNSLLIFQTFFAHPSAKSWMQTPAKLTWSLWFWLWENDAPTCSIMKTLVREESCFDFVTSGLVTSVSVRYFYEGGYWLEGRLSAECQRPQGANGCLLRSGFGRCQSRFVHGHQETSKPFGVKGCSIWTYCNLTSYDTVNLLWVSFIFVLFIRQKGKVFWPWAQEIMLQ